MYTTAKHLTVFLYWCLILKLVWCPRVLKWSLNGSNLPGQADSQQGIISRLVVKTGHWCSCILWYVDFKTASNKAIWLLNFVWIGTPFYLVVNHRPLSTPLIEVFVVLTSRWIKSYQKCQAFQLYINWRV